MTRLGEELTRRLKRFSEAMEKAESIPDRFTVRTVRLNLRPEPYSPELVKKTRRILNASQAIFAQFLGVSLSAVRDWEQGVKPPNGAACRLMDEIRKNPNYFIGRLQELSSSVTS